MRWTQWPTSAFGSGMYCDFRPRLIGFQVLPPSSVRNAPAAEMAMKIRFGLLGSSRIVCRHIPPAPGCQRGPVPLPRSPGSSFQVLAAVGRAEDRGIFDAGIDGVRIGQRRLEVPDALELPRMLRAVVPLVRGQRLAGLRECRRRICCSRPAAVPGAGGSSGPIPAGPTSCRRRRTLDDLPEPAAVCDA